MNSDAIYVKTTSIAIIGMFKLISRKHNGPVIFKYCVYIM